MLSRPLDAILENVINLKLGVNLRCLLCMKALSLLAGEAADYIVLSEGKKTLVIERQQELNLKIGGEHKNEIT